ncbi:FtsK/SpoIIIE family DNA translocase [Schleiferia thermophila]|uniref:S-DNA-T family DNA segregation ATPase FtsK/SpoIIIE n=1 Tax=Schleiferia thermophila TaxID=884107 RepID=A0A369A6P0_9FLAO|nr:DNA translocase FtsK [Schleiferia thermophila]RCX05012.1 S-DNA-T family DNA segregation ATPase FtsK/SpoIIIE [Schleiferia thermophila]GCD79470.1 DNA translocase FtsK [Schleiferia thermophila]
MPPKKATKSTKNSQNSRAAFHFSDLLSKPAYKLFAGFFLLFSALFIAGSLVSYFIYWKSDMSAFDQTFWQLISNRDFTVRNLWGKLGAALAHSMVYRSAGVAAFAWVYVLFQMGSRLALNLGFRGFSTVLIRFLFIIIWLPTFLGLVLPDSLALLAGANGYFLAGWLVSSAGPAGAYTVLFFALLTYLAASFEWTPEKVASWLAALRSAFKSKKQKKSTPAGEALESFDYTNETWQFKNHSTPTNSDNTSDSQLIPERESPNTDEKEDDSFTVEIKQDEQPPSDVGKNRPIDEIEVKEESPLDDDTANRLIKKYGEYDPTLELSSYKSPTLELLVDYGSRQITVERAELESNKDKIVETLQQYSIEISKIKATVGPTVTLYEIVPAPGIRISKIKNLEDDIALSLAAMGIRIIAPIPGKGTIGIEVPNAHPQIVPMRTLLVSEKFQNTEMELPLVLGKTISNETFVADLTKMPHLLMAGATGQGKSVGINTIITSILYKKHPSQVKFVLVDPKKVELNLYNKIERHYLARLPNSEESIITDTKKVVYTLNSLTIEMDNRYELLKAANVRNLKEYNTKFIQRRLNPEEGHRYLPYIVLVIDEFADLIMTAGKEIETPIARLAQLARAIGIHLIIATQRPSVNVITGVIKANFPARIAFRVSSKIDSRTILDTGGAEQLIGRGDMLLSTGNDLIRLQCAFIDTPEVENIVDFIGSQRGYPSAYLLPEYVGDDEEPGILDVDLSKRDSKFDDAARLVVATQQGSASLIQRKLGLGFARAGRLIDQLEAAGIIGPFEGSKARQVLVKDEAELEHILKNLKEKFAK